MSDAPSVPCGSCSLCCKGNIFLFPDESTTLPTVVATRMDGARHRRLHQKPNGDCSHLIEGRCGVYDQRPQICRGFDCRDHYFLPAAERRRREAILTDPGSKAVIARGRALAEQAKK